MDYTLRENRDKQCLDRARPIRRAEHEISNIMMSLFYDLAGKSVSTKFTVIFSPNSGRQVVKHRYNLTIMGRRHPQLETVLLAESFMYRRNFERIRMRFLKCSDGSDTKVTEKIEWSQVMKTLDSIVHQDILFANSMKKIVNHAGQSRFQYCLPFQNAKIKVIVNNTVWSE